MNTRKAPPGLWKLALYVAGAHLVAILILSPRFYCASENSPEALFARGEQAMTEGKHVEAMQYFRQVMDQQPKPPPVYARAAEQHRLADRLARQESGRKAQEVERQATQTPETKEEATVQSGSTTQPSTRPAVPAPAPQPNTPFIPPELQR